MSTLKVTNIQATGETASRAVSGVAGAWVDLTGSGTATINESLNTSSVTDNGTGDYTFAFTNNPASDKYAFSGSANNNRNSTGWGYECYLHQQITSSVRVKVSDNPYTNYDCDPVSVSIHGDLA